MKPVLLLCLFVSSANVLSAQDKFQQNDVYFEAFGSGLFGSLNYEHQFTSKPGLGFRFGVGFYPDQVIYPTIPLGLNYLVPLNKSGHSFLDAGLGTTFTTEEVFDFTTQERYKRSVVIFMPSLGYRRHTKNSLMYRASAMALIWDGGVYPYIGLSFGKRF